MYRHLLFAQSTSNNVRLRIQTVEARFRFCLVIFVHENRGEGAYDRAAAVCDQSYGGSDAKRIAVASESLGRIVLSRIAHPALNRHDGLDGVLEAERRQIGFLPYIQRGKLREHTTFLEQFSGMTSGFQRGYIPNWWYRKTRSDRENVGFLKVHPRGVSMAI